MIVRALLMPGCVVVETGKYTRVIRWKNRMYRRVGHTFVFREVDT